MALFKLQVQDDDQRPQHWRDVCDENGKPLLFSDDPAARAKLAELFPVLLKMEQLGLDRKRARVIVANAFEDVDKENGK